MSPEAELNSICVDGDKGVVDHEADGAGEHESDGEGSGLVEHSRAD